MAYVHDGGTNTQKIDLEKIITDAIEKLHQIEAANDSQSRKTNEFIKLAERIKNQIHDDKRKKVKVAASTYKRYLTRVRTAVKATGITHHSLRSDRATAGTLARVMRDHPEYVALLEPLQHEPADTIGALKNDILKAVQADKLAAKRSEAYKAIKAVKVDHEVLRHLHLDDVVVADLKEQAATSLAAKKTSVVTLAHADIVRSINDGLDSGSYSNVAFALALACGRRSIEVLYTGSFEAVSDHIVTFNGQAKKQAGIETAGYEIYTLIPAAEFVAAFNRFRSLEPVQALHEDFGSLPKDERHRKINGRCAKTLNEAAKRSLHDKRRTFKDARAIYTRVCLDTFYKSDDRWSSVDEDVFIKHLLGHGSASTAGASAADMSGGEFEATLNYKQFKIDYEADTMLQPKQADKVIAAVAAVEAVAVSDTNDGIANVGEAIEQAVNDDICTAGVLAYHAKVIEWSASNPHRKITFSALYKKAKGGIGGHRDTVRAYVDTAASAIEQYNATR